MSGNDEATVAPKYLAQFGQLPAFYPETEKIAAYLERVELFFAANDIKPDKRVAIFLSSVGGKMYSLLRDLLATVKPSEKQLEGLFAALKTHYEPQPLIIAERFYFYKRNQAANESIAEYLAALRQLTTHCAFANFLNDALRDRLACGLRNTTIQKRLLSEKDLTLDTAVHLAQSMEAAEANVTKLQNDDLPAPVNHTDAARYQHARKVCYRCGGNDHAPTACRYKDFTCNKCKKRGHLAKVCKSSEKSELPPSNNSTQQRGQHKAPGNRNPAKKGQNTIRESSVEELEMFKVDKKSSRPITVALDVNRQKLSMEVDTGAAVSVISEATKKNLFPGVCLSKTPMILTT